MKTKYKINNNELIINLYNLNEINIVKKNINKLIMENNIKFKGNKIIIYIDGILSGTFYLINYYLKKYNYFKGKIYLNINNSYFYENNYIEINYN